LFILCRHGCQCCFLMVVVVGRDGSPLFGVDQGWSVNFSSGLFFSSPSTRTSSLPTLLILLFFCFPFFCKFSFVGVSLPFFSSCSGSGSRTNTRNSRTRRESSLSSLSLRFFIVILFYLAACAWVFFVSESQRTLPVQVYCKVVSLQEK